MENIKHEVYCNDTINDTVLSFDSVRISVHFYLDSPETMDKWYKNGYWTINGTKYHNNEYCAETTYERIQNQDETDVDCGGPWVRKKLV